jgi:hypothetical protein
MTVTMDTTPEGFAFQAWWSGEKPHPMDLKQYPHIYTYMGNLCTWFIYCNRELTPKVIVMCGEQADRLCAHGEEVNKNRKLSNR